MFFLISIWKRLSATMIIALLLGTGFLGNSTPANAAGETYSWKDAGQTAIEASSGAYAAPFELIKSATDASGISFSGQGQITCGASKANATVTLHVATKDYQKTTPTPVDDSAYNQLITDCKTTTIDSKPIIAAAGATDKTDSPGSCQGSFAWLACPLINDISKFISDTAVKVITPFLHVNTVSRENTPGLYSAWQGVKNFAEVLFIVIFLIIIFSTTIGTGLDQYSIKRMLPRVVAGAILVQFSFFISAIIIDIGNIMGAGVADLITVVTAGTPDTGGTAGSFLTNIPTVIAPLVAGTAIWASLPLVLPTLGILLLSVLAILFTFAARYILIAVLVVLSPLALVAWILPNTDHYFKQWYKSFIRLILMYPIIIGLFTLGGRLGDILGSSSEVATNGTAGLFIDILKPFIVVIIFLSIPVAFKWAGGLMHFAHNTMSVLNKGTSASVRESSSYKRRKDEVEGRKLDRIRRFKERETIKGLANNTKPHIFGKAGRGLSTGLMTARALSLGGAPIASADINRRYAKNTKSLVKELDLLTEAENPGNIKMALLAGHGDNVEMAKLKAAAPTLVPFTRTVAGRAALASKRTETETTEITELNQVRKSAASSPRTMYEYGAINSAMGKERRSKPFILSRVMTNNDSYEVKDVTGTVVRMINRKMGDVDLNGVATNLRMLTGPVFRDKFSQSNLAVLHQRTDTRATADEIQDAREIAETITESLDPTVVGQTFNPGNRNALPISTKIDWYKGFKANNDVFMSTPSGQRITDEALRQLAQDPALIEQLRIIAGIPESTFTAPGMTDALRADEIRAWLKR